MMPNRPSLDEILEKRSNSIVSTDRGDAVVKTFRAPTSWNEETRSARFTMTAQSEDRMGDIVRTSGIDLTYFDENPILLLFHNSRSWPIGNWSDTKKIGGKNPRMEGTANFLEAGVLDDADKAASLVSAGVLRACSIGFIPKDYDWILDDEGRNTWGLDFKESELIECSIVPVPAHPSALVKHAGADMALCKDFLEEVLDGWAKTPDGLIVPRSEYEKEYFSVQAKEGPVTMSIGGKTFEAVLSEKIEDEDHPVDLDMQREAEEAVERELVSLQVKFDVDQDSVTRAGEEATQGVLDVISKHFSSLFKVKTEEPQQEREEPKLRDPQIVKGSAADADAALIRMKSALVERNISA